MRLKKLIIAALILTTIASTNISTAYATITPTPATIKVTTTTTKATYPTSFTDVKKGDTYSQQLPI